MRLSMVHHVLTHSSVQIVEKIIRPTQINALYGSTTSIENDIQKSIKSFAIVESNQFVQSWMTTKHDFEKNQDILSKCS